MTSLFFHVSSESELKYVTNTVPLFPVVSSGLWLHWNVVSELQYTIHSAQSPPEYVDIRSSNYSDLLNEVSSKTYAFAQDKGGSVPYIAIKEIVENLLHADIEEAVITILLTAILLEYLIKVWHY